jgi:hypothetical protein
MNNPNDPNQTQRRIWLRPSPSPKISDAQETDRLCTVCNKILVHVPNSTVCSCQNGHMHSYPDFVLVQSGV